MNEVRNECDILFVEDESSMLDTLKLIFEPHYEIIAVRSAAEAESVIRAASEIRLLWTDLNLPNFATAGDRRCGLDVAHLFRDKFPGTPMVMVCGSIEDERAQKFAKLQNTGLFEKIAVAARMPKIVSAILSDTKKMESVRHS